MTFPTIKSKVLSYAGTRPDSRPGRSNANSFKDTAKILRQTRSGVAWQAVGVMREVVGWARELLAGNGIVLDYDIGRFVADSEALYSYEGTREINSLIVGRAVTGLSAFV